MPHGGEGPAHPPAAGFAGIPGPWDSPDAYDHPEPPRVPGAIHPRSSCQPNDFLSINIDLLGLDVDANAYLNLLGGSPSSSVTPTITKQYRTLCGQSLRNRSGGTTCSAQDATDCLQQCQAGAVQLTAAVGALQDCLGATLTDGVSVDNCLYFVGGESDILDADAGVLTPERDANSYCL